MKLLKGGVGIIAIALLLFYAGCSPSSGGGDVTINVAGVYGSQSFALNTPLTDPDGRRIKFKKFRFFLSHITFIKNDDSEVEVKDVALIDLGNANTLNLNITAGDFKAIKFGLGVDSIQNQTDPNSGNLSAADALSTLHPSSQGMYWFWTNSYVFENVEAVADSTTSGPANYNMGLEYHLVGNTYYRQIEINKIFSIDTDHPVILNLNLDVKKIFYGSTETIDIITEPVTNSEAPTLDIANQFITNFSNSFTLN